MARSLRSASSAALGGSSSLGHFRVADPPPVAGLPKSYSIAADGSASHLTPAELGRQELYTQVPFTAVFGLQKKERTISQAFANYAADLDISNSRGLSSGEKDLRRSRASMMILDEIEFEAQVVTMPLVFAVVSACACQFLVGYSEYSELHLFCVCFVSNESTLIIIKYHPVSCTMQILE